MIPRLGSEPLEERDPPLSPLDQRIGGPSHDKAIVRAVGNRALIGRSQLNVRGVSLSPDLIIGIFDQVGIALEGVDLVSQLAERVDLSSSAGGSDEEAPRFPEIGIDRRELPTPETLPVVAVIDI